MSEYKLADTIEIDVSDAKAVINKFFSKVPKVQSFLNQMGYLSKTRGFIRTPKPYSRIRFFDGWENKDDFKRQGSIERAGKNMIPQGGNADMTKLALIYIYKIIKENNYPVRIVHIVHDEIQTEVKAEFAKEWSDMMAVLMKKAAEIILNTVPMEVDCKPAMYWSK